MDEPLLDKIRQIVADTILLRKLYGLTTTYRDSAKIIFKDNELAGFAMTAPYYKVIVILTLLIGMDDTPQLNNFKLKNNES